MKTLAKDIQLSIIVPFRNERAVLDTMLAFHASLPNEGVEFVYVDDGSTDTSLAELQRQRPDVAALRLGGVGTGKAFLAGAQKSRGRFVLLLPADCTFAPEAVHELLREISLERSHVLVFEKMYTGAKLMSPYAGLQNLVLLRWVKLASWTNGFVIHRELVPELASAAQEHFLNDLELSRNLRSHRWHILGHELSVSVRRYELDGAWRRILLNGLIVVLWQLRLASTKQLHTLYLRGKSGKF